MKQKHTAKRKLTRHFLLLQGPKSPFFANLAQDLRREGCKTTKINFNAGDALFYGTEAIEYKHSLRNWAGYVSDIAKIRGITDLVVFDDKNPIHADAIAEFKKQELNVHVFAAPYFDNDHITLESDGTNANSALPREPMFYMRTPTIHKDLEPVGIPNSVLMRKVYEMSYALVTKKFAIPFSPLSALKQFALQKALRGKKYFVARLEADEVHRAKEIIASFAKHTTDAALVICAPSKVETDEKRVLQLRDADLPKLVRGAEGMIVAGSTDGIIALENEKPLVALDAALFNFAGLTNQSKLLGFWHRRVAANPSLYGKFKNHIAAKTQVNGDFFSYNGRKLASQIAAQNIIQSGNFALGNNVSENV